MGHVGSAGGGRERIVEQGLELLAATGGQGEDAPSAVQTWLPFLSLSPYPLPTPV